MPLSSKACHIFLVSGALRDRPLSAHFLKQYVSMGLSVTFLVAMIKYLRETDLTGWERI